MSGADRDWVNSVAENIKREPESLPQWAKSLRALGWLETVLEILDVDAPDVAQRLRSAG